MDKLRELYDKFANAHPDAVPVQYFQAGFTAAASSMRERAMALAQKANAQGKLNDLVNAIGSLPDIPV